MKLKSIKQSHKSKSITQLIKKIKGLSHNEEMFSRSQFRAIDIQSFY